MPTFFQPRTVNATNVHAMGLQRMTETYGSARPYVAPAPVAPRPSTGTYGASASGFSPGQSMLTSFRPPVSAGGRVSITGTGGDQPPAAAIGGGDSPYTLGGGGGGGGTTADGASSTGGSALEEIIATWSKGWRAVALLLVVALIVLYLLKR